jgi:hypothetical protein
LGIGKLLGKILNNEIILLATIFCEEKENGQKENHFWMGILKMFEAVGFRKVK